MLYEKTQPVLVSGVLILLLMGNVFAGEEIVGQKAPKINVGRWLTPNPPTVASLEGKVYVVEFWTTWCPHCIKVIPRINQLTNKYKKKKFSLLHFRKINPSSK